MRAATLVGRGFVLKGIAMRIIYDKKENLLRLFSKSCEIIYMTFGLSGLVCEIEFPSDWHEEQRAWVRFGGIFIRIGFSFHWYKTVPDEYQCSGPTYGFCFFDDVLFIRYGKDNGRPNTPRKTIQMPWGWRHIEHKILSEEETHSYEYTMNSGEVQEREATIKLESRLWRRPWIPSTLYSESININFNEEVGERSGSWKGGVLGCGYETNQNETPLECLRRMEKERVFK